MFEFWDVRALKLRSSAFQHISLSKWARYSDLLSLGEDWKLVVFNNSQMVLDNIENHLIRWRFFKSAIFFRDISILKHILFGGGGSQYFLYVLHYWYVVIFSYLLRFHDKSSSLYFPLSCLMLTKISLYQCRPSVLGLNNLVKVI